MTLTTHDPRCDNGWIPDGDSVAPCPDCRPDAFVRWAGGCYAPDHDRATCPTCQAGAPAPKSRRRRPGPRPYHGQERTENQPPEIDPADRWWDR